VTLCFAPGQCVEKTPIYHYIIVKTGGIFASAEVVESAGVIFGQFIVVHFIIDHFIAAYFVCDHL
jgi:hypothetical protein